MSWREEAIEAGKTLARSGDPYTADDLIEAVGLPDEHHSPNGRNNAVGSIFRELKASGWIEEVGTARSRQPKRKGGLILVWKGTPAVVQQMRLFEDLP